MAQFKFAFHTQKKIERPTNVLDKKPGDYDLVSLEDEILDLIQKTENTDKTCKNNKPQRYDQEPVCKDIPIKDLQVAGSIQRPFSVPHALGIAVRKWDSRRPFFPLVVFNPLTLENWIIEGNHTSMSKGYRAAKGLYPDVKSKKWNELKIRCQVIELEPDEDGNVDMSFAREIFLGTNGGDRLKLDDFDKYQNYVLLVRQDYAGDISKCDDNKARKMYGIQLACESNLMCPVHPRSEKNTTLPGAITNVEALMKMSVDGVNFTGKHHRKFWDNLKVDSIELVPMEKLRKLIDNNKSDPDEFQSAQFDTFMYEMAVVMQKFGGTPAGFRNFATQVWQEYYCRKEGVLADEKIPDPKSEFSLVLWLKLHQKVGGTYKCIPNSIYTQQFVENNIDCVDCIPKSKQKIFKEFK
jgi:hypothetical protein